MTCSGVDRRLFRAAGVGFAALLMGIGCSGSGNKPVVDAAPVADAPPAPDAALPGVLGISPAMYDFKTVEQMKSSAVINFTVTNTGAGPSGPIAPSITGADMGQFAIASNGCLSSLAPGVSCTIGVTFSPDSAGARTATLQVLGKGAEKATAVLTGSGVAPAAFSVTPNVQDFGSVVVMESSLKTDFTVTNTGGSDTVVPTVALAGVDAGHFTVTANGCQAALAPAAKCVISVRFNPSTVGAKSAMLQIIGASGATAAAAISGTGIAAGSLRVTPTVQMFPATIVGATSAALAFTVSNSGGAPATGIATSISGTDSSQFAISNSTCAAALAPAATCTIQVQFKPAKSGALTAALHLTSTSTTTVLDATLNGTGLKPATLTVNTNLHTFGSVVVGMSSEPVAIKILNEGDVDSGTLTTAISGANQDDFSIVSAGCSGTLAPGASCQVEVRFNATAVGARTAKLTVSGTPGGSPATVLNGTGVQPGNLSIGPTPQAFGDVTVGSMSSATTFTVTNTGGSATGALNTALGGANPTQFPVTSGGNSCQGATLQAGASCTISVLFAPTSAGAKSASLTVTGNPGGSASAALAGNALTPASLSASPTGTVDFGSIATGSNSPTNSITIKNDGMVATGTIAATLSGTNADQFTVTNGCTTLLPAATCTVVVRFSPPINAPVGPKTAQINVSATPGSSLTIVVTGNAVDPASLVLAPAAKNYNDVVVDSFSDQTFTLTNNGAPNTGAINVSLNGANASDFSVTANTCSQLLQGNNCSITVRFRPAAIGAKVATLDISSAAVVGGSVPLSGNGLPKLTVSPSGRDFGPGSYPARVISGPLQTFVVTCTAGGATCGPLVTNSDASNQFTTSIPGFPDTCTGNSIAAGTTCSVTLKFIPTTSGANKNFTLMVTGGAKERVDMPVTGNAVAPMTISAAYPLHPLVNSIADTVLGSYDVITYTVANALDVPTTGTLSTVLSGVNRDQYAVTADSCAGEVLAAGGTCSFTVRFIPTALDVKAATVTVSGTPGESVSASLSGKGLPNSSLSISPGTLDFAGIFTGSTSGPKTLTVTNAVGAGTSGALTIALTNSGGYSLGGTCISGTTTLTGVVGGNTCDIVVTFAPTAGSNPGSRPGGVSVTGAPGGTVTATLTATALNPISITPNPFDFGGQARATNTDQVFTVKNDSARP